MRYFVYYYVGGRNIKGTLGGPIKIFDLCTNLVKLGHEVVLFGPDIGSPEKQTSARVVKIPFLGVPIVGIIWHEIALFFLSLFCFFRSGCSAVYVRITTSLVPLLIGRLSGAVLITEVNDDPLMRYASEHGIMRLKLPLVRFLDKLNLAASRAVLVVNKDVGRSVIEGLGVREERVRIFPSGANTEMFRPREKTAVCAERSLDPALRYICFVGSYNRLNDYEVLIRTAEKVFQKFHGTRCLIVGDVEGPVGELISRSSLCERFILPGRVPPLTSAGYMACAEVCLAPLRPECPWMTSVKIFDYLACGKPVVASLPRGGENIFAGCPAVLTAPAGDPDSFSACVLELLSDPARAAELGALGRDFVVKNYDRAALAEKVVSVTMGRGA